MELLFAGPVMTTLRKRSRTTSWAKASCAMCVERKTPEMSRTAFRQFGHTRKSLVEIEQHQGGGEISGHFLSTEILPLYSII